MYKIIMSTSENFQLNKLKWSQIVL